MNILAEIKFGLRLGVALLLLPLLFSCSSSDGGSNTSGQALDSAARNVAKVIETNADALAGIGADSAALASLLEPLGLSLADNGDEGLSDEFIDFLETLLDDNTAVITVVGGIIQVRPAPADSCDDIATSLGFAQDDPMYDDCLDAMADFLITIDEDSSESGTLSMGYAGHEFVQMVYSPTRLTVTSDIGASVAALESLVLQLDPTATLDTPETLAGVMELDMQELGPDHGAISLSITEALQVVDATEGYDINIAPTTLFSVDADGVAGEATLTSSLAAIDALFPVEADTLGTVPGDLALAGADISVSITDGGDGASGDLSVGPVTFDIDNSGSTENIFSFLLDPEFTVDPVSGAITLVTALDLDLEVTDDVYDTLTGQNGTLNVDAAAGTVFTEAGDGVFQVTAGIITFVGTGDFIDSNGSISVGNCFDMDGPALCP